MHGLIWMTDLPVSLQRPRQPLPSSVPVRSSRQMIDTVAVKSNRGGATRSPEPTLGNYWHYERSRGKVLLISTLLGLWRRATRPRSRSQNGKVFMQMNCHRVVKLRLLSATIVAGAFAAGLSWPARSQVSADQNIQVLQAALLPLDVKTSCTSAGAAKTSLYPLPKILLHYDAALGEKFVEQVILTAKRMRFRGYITRAAPGGPIGSVQIVISGKTSQKLIFDRSAIQDAQVQAYAMGLYEKYIGKPEANMDAVAEKMIAEQRQIAERLEAETDALRQLLDITKHGAGSSRQNALPQAPNPAHWDLHGYCDINISEIR